MNDSSKGREDLWNRRRGAVSILRTKKRRGPAPGEKGFQIFLPRGTLKGRSTWSRSQTHSGDVHKLLLRSESFHLKDFKVVQRKQPSLTTTPANDPTSSKGEVQRTRWKDAIVMGTLTFCFINLFALIALVFDSSVLPFQAFLHCPSCNTTEVTKGASRTPNTNEKGKKGFN